MNIKRRDFLALAVGTALATSAPLALSNALDTFPSLGYPFKLGVASGDPLADGFVIWTRLAPQPYDDQALPMLPIKVKWKVATDKSMKNVVQQGISLAKPTLGHSVHVEVVNLAPATIYFYQFECDNHLSSIGKAKTLPLPGSATEKVTFALASCQSIQDGYYAAYADMAKQDLDFVLHVGDYIYEGDYIAAARRIPVSEAKTLGDYRALHARYKLDPNLQKAHQNAAWLSIWDDHEVSNDHGGLFSQASTDSEVNLARRIAGYQAYYEHMPLRIRTKGHDDQFFIYQRNIIGDLLQLDMLDFRQYRDMPVCIDENHRNINLISKESCPESYSDKRTGLGWEQERWLMRGLGYAKCRWNVIAQTTIFTPLDLGTGPGYQVQQDTWGGYAATRQRIIDTIASKKMENVVCLGGDIHASYAGVVHKDPFDTKTPGIMTEIVGTSISSGGGGIGRKNHTDKLLKEHGFNSYFEPRYRGYVLNTVTKDNWASEFRYVDNPLDPHSEVRTGHSLNIASGKVGFS